MQAVGGGVDPEVRRQRLTIEQAEHARVGYLMDQSTELEVGRQRRSGDPRGTGRSPARAHTPPDGMDSVPPSTTSTWPGDPGRGIRGQEQCRLGDVVGFAQSLEREPRRDGVAGLLPQGAGEIGRTKPGASALTRTPGPSSAAS